MPPSGLRSRLRACNHIGAEGARVAVEAFQSLPRARHGELLQALRELEAHPWTFQIALALVWRSGAGSRAVAEAAGPVENLREWFAYARFDWPAGPELAEALTTWVPREVTLYRGGRGDPARVAAEFSWTPLKPIAGLFGCASTCPRAESDGPPVVVRRVVHRRDVAVAFLLADQEHVVFEPGPWEIETQDPDVLADLFAEGREIRACYLKESAEIRARWRARDKPK